MRIIVMVLGALCVSATVQAQTLQDVDRATAKLKVDLDALDSLTCGTLRQPMTADLKLKEGQALEAAYYGVASRGSPIPADKIANFIVSFCNRSEDSTPILSIVQMIPGMQGWTGRWGN